MEETDPEDLRKAYRKERDPGVRARMVAVNSVCVKMDVGKTADLLMQCPDRVSHRARRSGEGGIGALRDIPRSGRPPKVRRERISRMIKKSKDGRVIPRKLRADIRESTGVLYHMTSVRRILRKLDMSPKVSQQVHTSKPDIDTIRRWQRSAKRRISRLKREGFVTAVMDESVFVSTPSKGRKYWSPVGEPVTVPYDGRRPRTVAYGAMTADGRRFFRTYDRFDGRTFLKYFKELCGHYGKVLVVMDGAPQHRTKDVRRFLADHPDTVRAMCLPAGTPELSAVEEYWHQAKRDVLVSEYYATFGEMRRTLSEYLRTSGPRLDIMKYIGRQSLVLKDF